MLYFCDSRRIRQAVEPAAVDLGLPVGPPTLPRPDRELGYWPRYDTLEPHQRRIYLDWLAQGRQALPPELGYFFLFMYGLERRSLVDQQDQAVIFEEMLRLRDLYAASGQAISRSFDGYTTSFLWYLAVAAPSQILEQQVERLARTTRVWSEEHVACVLAWFAATRRALPAWAAYVVADFLPQTARSVILRRVGTEFRDLFAARYRTRFGDGMVLQSSKRALRHTYRTASAAVRAAELSIPNPLGISSQFKPLIELWDDCLSELKKLSGVVAKQGGGELTAAAWEAMPVELREGIDHPLTDAVTQVVTRHARAGGQTVFAVSDLLAALGQAVPASDRVTAKQARALCQTLEYTEYCIEPDARLTDSGYRADEKVAIFLRMDPEPVSPERYVPAGIMLRAGYALAASDGEVHADEVELMSQQIRHVFDLSPGESRRLEVLKHLLEESPPTPSTLGKTLKALAPGQREATAKLLVALVAADGVITDAERKALRRGYSALGLPTDRADQDLARLAVASPQEEPVVIAVADANAVDPGERIPPPPEQKPVGLRLDRAAIAAIMNETRDVAKLLADAMQTDELAATVVEQTAQVPVSAGPLAIATLPVASTSPPASKQSAPTHPAATPSSEQHAIPDRTGSPDIIVTSDPTLPARYAQLYQLLLAKGEWTRAEAEALARQQGQMLAGATDALNEWACERYGGPLFIDEGDRLVVETSLLN